MPEAHVMVETKRRNRRNARIVMVLTAVAVTGALILNLPAFYFLRSDYKALDVFLHNLDAARFGDAYVRIAPEMQARTDYPAMVRQQEAIKERMGRFQSFDVRHLDSHGSRSRRITNIRATLHYERGSLDFDFVLFESYGQWYVWSFEQK